MTAGLVGVRLIRGLDWLKTHALPKIEQSTSFSLQIKPKSLLRRLQLLRTKVHPICNYSKSLCWDSNTMFHEADDRCQDFPSCKSQQHWHYGLWLLAQL